jgi:tetratricopeptide (TPR) repeat protein
LKRFPPMRQSSTLRFFLGCFSLFVSLPAISVPMAGQSQALTDCSHAFYRGDFAQAAQIAETYVHSHPTDVPVRVMLGRTKLAQGDFSRAFEELRTALVSDPHNIDALYYLSIAARELSQKEHQRLFELAPDSDRVHQLLGEAALAAEDRTEAEEEFLLALKANPHSVDAATELAELKRSQSKFDEAITYYLQAAHIGQPNYEIAYGLGACYTYKQDYAQATEWLRKATALAPDSVAARFALGNALFQNGQLDAAILELKASLQIQPRMKQAYFLLGRAYSKLGRQDEAQAAFKRLDELNRSEVPEQNKGLPDDSPKPDAP